jgi:two-component system, LytTR family, response regulator
MKAVLVDDEKDNINSLWKLLENYCPQVTVVGVADGVETATGIIRATSPDLVFLDIEMNQGNAFDLLNRLQPVNFQVIFVTAFDNHAIRAIKYNALDYLLKPVNIRELCEAVERLSDKIVQNDILGRVKDVLQTIGGANPGDQRIAIPTVNGLSFVVLRDIIRLEAKGTYTIFHLPDKVKVTATGTISDYEDRLSRVIFFRVHHSHIINLNKIKSYQKGKGGYVIMDDDGMVEVAARRRQEFLHRLLK